MLVHLMDDLLELLDRRPDFESFLLDGQTIVAEDYLEVRPDRREDLERFVAAGRLSMGPWYVLPDTFLVSGEAIIRNLKRGRRQARAFGGGMDVGYIPDSFGHTGQIPQILRGFGIDNAIVWRGFGGEPGQEGSEYRWRSPDGSEVLMEHLSALGYSGAYLTERDAGALARRFDAFRSHAEHRARTSEVLMLSGGDHHWPVDHLPEILAILNDTVDGEARVVHSSLTRFIESLSREVQRDDLPVVEGELRFGYRWAFNVTGGVYSSRMYLKQANAHAQRRLERYLEPLNARAVLAGGRSQRPLLDYGWSRLLQNHPHDSICGCSIDHVHREMATRFAALDELGDGVERFAWMRLAPDAEGAAGDDQTIVIFNPSPHDRDEIVECDVSFYRQQVVVGLNPDVVPEPPLPPVSGFILEDASGRPVPFEILERRGDFGLALNRHGYPAQSRVERFRVRVALQSLPALGFRTLRVRRSEAFAPPATVTGLSADARAIENVHLSVEAADDGAFYVTDKPTGVRFGPLGFLQDGADAGDAYNYSPPPTDQVLFSRGIHGLQIETLPGSLMAGLRVSGEWLLPWELESDLSARSPHTEAVRFATTATLTPFSRHVSFETEVHNVVRDHRLRVVFETGRQTNVHHADNAFAVLTRESRAFDPDDFAIEVPAAVAPMHRFVAVEDREAGAVILGDGLPEYELEHDSGGVLALTLLRCVGELGRENLKLRPGGQGAWRNATPDGQCQGLHRFRYAFLPYAPEWSGSMGLINRVAESFLLPPTWRTLMQANASIGEEPFVTIEPDDLVLSALKQSEEGNDLVARVYNPGPRALTGRIRILPDPSSVQAVNLEERPLPSPGEAAGSALTYEAGSLQDEWRPYSIHTYRITFSENRNR